MELVSFVSVSTSFCSVSPWLQVLVLRDLLCLAIKVVDMYQASCSGNAVNCVGVVCGSIVTPLPWPSLIYSRYYTDNMNKHTINHLYTSPYEFTTYNKYPTYEEFYVDPRISDQTVSLRNAIMCYAIAAHSERNFFPKKEKCILMTSSSFCVFVCFLLIPFVFFWVIWLTLRSLVWIFSHCKPSQRYTF
jgi:hypothetical protein